MDYFASAPPEVQAIARQHFLTYIPFESYMGEYADFRATFDQGVEAAVQFYEEHEQEFAPVITAAFWSERERLTAGEPWPEVYSHGAHLLQDEFSEAEAVLTRVVEDEEFPPAHATLTLRLYQRRLATNTLPMTLTDEEYAALDVRSEAQRTGIAALLRRIDIELPATAR